MNITQHNAKILWEALGETETTALKLEIKEYKKKIQRFGNRQASRKGVSIKQLRTMAIFINDLANKYEQLLVCNNIKKIAHLVEN